MTEPTSAQDLFKGRHFDHEIIILCVRWYITFKLSFRDLVQMMAERGITLSHTTILRWVQQYVPEFEKRWSRYARPVGDSPFDPFVPIETTGASALGGLDRLTVQDDHRRAGQAAAA
jgi:hypothetical protein